MAQRNTTIDDVGVSAENIGGIDHTEVSLSPGVTVLSGRNATNRTSFLQTIMAGLGSDRASLKAGAEEGHVELTLDGETFTRTLTREDDAVRFGGDPYLDDPELADLFAFLLENNEARRAVERGDDLREIIMRPIDTVRIEREIEATQERKREIDEEIERIDRLRDELPTLTAERESMKAELEETREELAEVETELEDVDVDPAESADRMEELEALFADLREARSDLADVEFELETEHATVEELETERESLEADLEEYGEQDDAEHLEGRITELRSRKRALDETISELQSVIGFNEEMLDGDGLAADHALNGDATPSGDEKQVTEQLVAEDTTTCWTCGSEVERNRIEDTLDRLRELRSEKLSERNDVTATIDDLTTERAAIREAERDRQKTERRLERIETELTTARDRIEDLETDRESLEEEIADLEAETETLDETDYGDVLERHREANRLELEVERLESNLSELDETIEEHEETIEEREDLVERRDSVQSELTDLRTRVERIEADAVDSFNEHIESILAILEYENIERIWIERREDEVRDGRRKVTRSTFDLHVVRSAAGSAYRDSVDHLSESEREVTGLVFALAGYLVHSVHEELPFVLLDSLEAIDPDRIATLVGYFEDYVDYLVVALLPEDAQALDDEHTFVESI